MKSNVGGIDRVLRIAVGLVLIALAVTNTVGWWGWLGAVPLATGLMGWCPPYAIFGINTHNDMTGKFLTRLFNKFRLFDCFGTDNNIGQTRF